MALCDFLMLFHLNTRPNGYKFQVINKILKNTWEQLKSIILNTNSKVLQKMVTLWLEPVYTQGGNISKCISIVCKLIFVFIEKIKFP